MQKKKISLIGAGRLGLSFALLCDSKNYDVMCYEINQERKEQIKNKTLKTSEPQIEELLKDSNLKLSNTIKETLDHSNLIFIFVATPSKDTGEYDHSQIDRVINEIELLNVTGKTIVINCTVMPTYCQRLQDRLKEFNILYNPEFIAQGNIIDGLRFADIVLIGGIPPQELYELYDKIMPIPTVNFKTLSLTGAELAKIGINCFLTLKTAYANLIGEIAIQSGEEENVDDILNAIGSDKRIGNKYLGYGFPASGICLPRDLRALKFYIPTLDLTDDLLEGAIRENNGHLYFLFDYYTKKNPNKEVPFIFSHITYKKGVDILTESKQLELCLMFLREGYTVSLSNISKNLDLPKELLDFHIKGNVLFGEDYGYKVN